MAQFKVTATLITTRTITKTVDAKDLAQATNIVLSNAEKSDWQTKAELRTVAK